MGAAQSAPGPPGGGAGGGVGVGARGAAPAPATATATTTATATIDNNKNNDAIGDNHTLKSMSLSSSSHGMNSGGSNCCPAAITAAAAAAAPACASAKTADSAVAGAHLRGRMPTTTSAAATDAESQRYLATCAALERVLAERAAAHKRLRGRLTRAEAQRRAAAAAAASPADAKAPPAEAAAVAAAATTATATTTTTTPQLSYWAGPPIPTDDDARLRAVDAYGLLADAVLPDDDDDDDDGNHDNHETKTCAALGPTGCNNQPCPTSQPPRYTVRPAVDGALKLVCSVFGVEEAIVALFGDRRIFVRDRSEGSAFRRGDFSWRWSFCWWTLSPPTPTALVVRDVTQDARFSANSVAAQAGVRFYCGVPLIAPGGHRLGVLSFASREPRPGFDAASVAVASNLAELVARELAREVSAAMKARASAGARLRSEREASAPVLVVERVVGEEEGAGKAPNAVRWIVRHANGAWDDGRWLRRPKGANDAAPAPPSVTGADLWRDLFDASEALGSPGAARALAEAVDSGRPFAITGARLRSALLLLDDGVNQPPTPTTATLRFTPAAAPGALMSPSSSSLTREDESASRPLTAAPAFCPDAPPDPATRARLAALWFVDVEVVAAAAAGAEQGGEGGGAAVVASATASTPALLVGGGGPLPHLHPSEATATATTTGSAEAGATATVSAATTTTTTTTNSSVRLLLPPPLAAPARFSSEAAPGLPPSLRGLVLGTPLASGSHGRVFRGKFHAGARVAVKVLDAADVHRLDPATGAALEASLGERLRHPFVVQTLAWGVVGDPASALPARPRAWTRVAAAGNNNSGGGRGSGNSGGGGGGSGSGGGGRAAAAAAVVRHGELLFPEDASSDEDENAEGNRQPGPGRRSANPQTWLVLELCELGSLQEAIDAGWLRTSRDPLTSVPHLPAVLATAREVGAALAYLHSEGVVHGDLSAWNVLLSSSGPTSALGGRGWCAKVGDFGLARACGGGGGRGGGGGGSQSDSGSHIQSVADGHNSSGHNSDSNAAGPPVLTTSTHGTVTHCAPELLARGELSPAADVYAFGVCLWQMWTGARPWHGLTHAQIVQAVTSEGTTLAWPSDAPEGLAALGEACLARDPRERPSAADIVDVLAPLAEVLEASADQGGAAMEDW